MAPSDASSRHQSRHDDDQSMNSHHTGSQAAEIATRSTAASQHRRNDGQPLIRTQESDQQSELTRSESWVEISSQPSSSSLSSIGDEIVTTGLRVGNNSYPPRRRRLSHQLQQQPQTNSSPLVAQAAAHAGTSSQEEYDETESEEDRLMTSSTENVQPPMSLAQQQTAIGPAVDSDSDDDDDENATALGRPSSPPFRPQPNAFSRPPAHLAHRHSTSGSIPHHHPSFGRPSLPGRSQTRVRRGPSNFMSPSYQADNEAALRASLTTLLSCAAAARGLPKRGDDDLHIPGPSAGAGVRPSAQPMELRLVPESELMAETETPPPPADPAPTRNQHRPRTASNSSAPSGPSGPSSTSSRQAHAALAAEKNKRAATSQQAGRPARATKKKRTASSSEAETVSTMPTFISPTLLTWVVSAGVVVLVSVVGFGAGYVIGREVGRQEGALSLGAGGGAGGSSLGNASASCGREVVRSTSGGTLRRFRWGSAMTGSVTA